MSDDSSTTQTGWSDYYKKVAERPPREFLRSVSRRFQQPGFAIDLGCGNGIEARFLLRHGWQVLAIDQQAAAIETLHANTPPQHAAALQTLVAPFAALELPPADLIWAGLSLPFTEPTQFDTLWQQIVTALKPGGRFAGDFFGPRHAWANSPDLSIHTKKQILALCHDMHLEYLIEEQGEGQTAFQGMQQLHRFSICVRK